MKNGDGIEVQQKGKGSAAELVQKKDRYGAGDDEVHQIGDAEFRVPVREAVQPAVHGAHREPPSNVMNSCRKYFTLF